MEKLTKQITSIPQRNKKDEIGKGSGSLAIITNDVEYIEDRTYKGKVKGFNGQWYWIILFVFFFFFIDHIEEVGIYFFLLSSEVVLLLGIYIII